MSGIDLLLTLDNAAHIGCCPASSKSPTTQTTMELPKYTEMEERLLRENRVLREKIKRQETEILDSITHTGVWIKKLEEISRYGRELLEKYEPEQP